MSIAFVAAYVLPTIAETNPGYVNDVLAATTGRGTAHGDIGLLQTVIKVPASPTWSAAWSSASRCTGPASSPAGRPRSSPSAARLTVALAVMPDAFYRLLAFPNGIAMIGLGYSLWRVARPPPTLPRREPPDTRVVSTAGAGLAPPARPATAQRRPGGRRTGWWVPPALLALAVIPVLGGAGRLVELRAGRRSCHATLASPPRRSRSSYTSWPPSSTPCSARSSSPPVCVAATPAGTAGRDGSWWRSARSRGLRAVDDAALPQKEGTGDLLWVFRLLVGSGMAASIVLGLVAIRRRDIARHRAWMTRAYALALGAGTQAFTVGFGEALFGTGVARPT